MTTPIWTAPPSTTALIFDCDGTLADTMPVHYRSWTWMLDQHGIPFPIEKFYGYAGMPTDRIIGLLAEAAGVEVHDIPAMTLRKETHYLESIDAVVPIGPVVEIASSYRGRLPMAVASGGERYIVERTLTAIGTIDWFDALVGAEDTERHKPEPDVFLEAARRLGVEPAGCVVFEDSDLGLVAAERAGMVGVDVRPWYRSA
ncbi:MAG: HAD-IA family hydrolase [Ilumatobacteraceae bacterium]